MARKNALFMNIDEHTTEETNETRYNTEKVDSHKNYRTRQKAGDTAEIPCRLPVITNRIYQNALTFNKNSNAYLQPLSNIGHIKYRDGILLLKGLPTTSAELSAFYTNENKNIEKFNLPLLKALYGIILNEFSGSLSESRSNDKMITIYYPDFSRKIGKSPNIGKADAKEFINNIRLFETVIGIIGNGAKGSDILPVLVFKEYNVTKNTISFASPYMTRIIKDIYEASIRKNRNGIAMLKKNGEPQMHPAYSYLIDMGIAKEKNKKAVEIVFIVVTLIEQAGNNIPHIRAKTIVERNTLLHKSLKDQTSGNKNILLKRAFSKAWQLLREKTFLTEAYKNIQLPDPEDTAKIPTASTLDKPFDFPHDGKIKSI